MLRRPASSIWPRPFDESEQETEERVGLHVERSRTGRSLIAFVSLALAVGLAACGGDGEEPAAEADPPETEVDAPDAEAPPEEEEGEPEGIFAFERDHSGVTLNVLIHPSFYEGVGGDAGLFREFEEISGATVNIITAPAGEIFDRAMLEWRTESPTLDVVFPLYLDTHDSYRQHLEPLDDWIAQAPDEWAFEDIIPGVQQYLVADEGTWAILFRWGIEAYLYRADLLEEAGVSPPTTFEEIDAVARAVHESTGRFGWVLRGIGRELAEDWLSLYATVGGTLYAEDGRTCNVNTPEAVHVLETVKDWFDTGVISPDTLAWDRDDSVAVIQQDRAAQGFFFAGRFPLLTGEDAVPAVQENLSWPDVHPGELSINTPQSVAISKYSENKETAWALIEYLLHPDNTYRHVTEWSGTLTRVTDLDDPVVMERFPIWEYIIDAARTSRVEPAHEQGNQVFELLNVELSAVLLGEKTAEQALSNACERINSLF